MSSGKCQTRQGLSGHRCLALAANKDVSRLIQPKSANMSALNPKFTGGVAAAPALMFVIFAREGGM
jgi:hypothetical protein